MRKWIILYSAKGLNKGMHMNNNKKNDPFSELRPHCALNETGILGENQYTSMYFKAVS